jgi:carbamoyltransferase
MIVLGLSGLENSVPFKKALWPSLEEPEYRISQGHDSAAALVVDGQIVVAAAEERLCRTKHTGDFPRRTIQYCLSAAGIEPGDIDEIAHSFDYSPCRPMYLMDPVSARLYNRVFSRETLIEQLNRALLVRYDRATVYGRSQKVAAISRPCRKCRI